MTYNYQYQQYNSYAHCPWANSGQGMPQATVWEHQDGTPVWEHHDGAPVKSTIPTAGEMRMTKSGFQATDSPSNVAISVNSEPATEASQVTEEPVLVTASVKIICPNEKRNEHKTFILRDVDVSKIKLVSSLKQEILTQFGGEVISKDLSLILVTITEQLNAYGLEMKLT